MLKLFWIHPLQLWFPTLAFLFPLCLISPSFSICQDKDRRATAGEKERNSFLSPWLVLTLGLHQNLWHKELISSLRVGISSHLAERPRINEVQMWKKSNSWIEFWDNRCHLIIYLFLQVNYKKNKIRCI